MIDDAYPDRGMTDESLHAMMLDWQSRLGLLDWRISVRFVKSGELSPDGETRGGSCQVHADDRLALIKILHPASYNRTSDFYEAFPDIFFVERTLVHEMLHIVFDGIIEAPEGGEDEFRARAHEQAINAVTYALVNGYAGAES